MAKEDSSFTTLYQLPGKLCKKEVNTVDDSSSNLWYMRFGHLSEKGLGILAKKQSLPMKDIYLNTCTHCFIGKHARVAFHSSGPYRRPNVLNLVHTDVCTIDTKSLGSASYFVTFIDDHSQKV